MFQFRNLALLHTHTHYLQTLFDNKTVYFVGGCVRDLLLGIIDDPTDLDLTMAGEPETIRQDMRFDETTTARFRTEKFGTMTIIPRDRSDVSYEITPFRQESGYEDARHPESIIRSNNLLADSNRRDFTINCLYRTSSLLDTTTSSTVTHHPSITCKDDKHLLQILKEHGGCYDISTHTLILQSHERIQQLTDDYHTAGPHILNALISQLPSVITLPPHHTSATVHSPLSILLDPHLGLNDLVTRKLRTVGDPIDRFTEDALRIVRGLRFVNILNQHLPDTDKQNSGFDFEKKTRKAMEQLSASVSTLSAERLQQEIMKVFKGNNPFGYISLLRELGLLPLLFPALACTIDNRQPVRYHPFDTYNHTILTLWHLQQLNNDPLVKLAMLYHDVGKPEQYAFMEKAFAANPENPDRTGYEHHAEISVKLAKQDFGALAFSSKEIDTLCRYIKRHHRPGEILDSKHDSRDKKLRELISDGDITMTLHLLDIAIADRLGQYNPLQTAAITELYELKRRAQELYETEGRFTMKELAINGNDLIQDCGLTPGPELGALLQKAFEWVMTDISSRNHKATIYEYIKTLSK